MENYVIYHNGTKTTISADELFSNSLGQTTFFEIDPDNGKYHTVAIVPKEVSIIRTDDLTEYHQKLKEIISDLEDVGFNDIERKLSNFKDYQQCMEIKRQSLLSYFREKLNE